MQSIIHCLNIGTLASSLSVASLGTVGVVISSRESHSPIAPVIEEPFLTELDFTLGDPSKTKQADANGGIDPPAAAGALEPESHPAFTQAQPLPSPPALPELADFEPLPIIPDAPKPKRATRQSNTTETNTTANSLRSSNPNSRKLPGQASANENTSQSDESAINARLAAGRMPAPRYPASCRRNGQSGTVIVEFTIDHSGRVISAHAAVPSAWPILDHEAVRTVRRWKFPPGKLMKLRRPIVFQLR
ncbi:MAG: TonB family protein [Luteolibacter sp.]